MSLPDTTDPYRVVLDIRSPNGESSQITLHAFAVCGKSAIEDVLGWFKLEEGWTIYKAWSTLESGVGEWFIDPVPRPQFQVGRWTK